MKRFLILMILILAAREVQAQTANPNSKILFDIAVTTAESNTYTYSYYLDGSTTRLDFTNVTCVANGANSTCTVNTFPTMSQGQHQFQLTARNAAGESAKSTSFSFSFQTPPPVITNIRIQ